MANMLRTMRACARWTKAMLRGRGGCYKHTFYGQYFLCVRALGTAGGQAAAAQVLEDGGVETRKRCASMRSNLWTNQ